MATDTDVRALAREALKPFADAAQSVLLGDIPDHELIGPTGHLTAGDLRRAAEALAALTEAGPGGDDAVAKVLAELADTSWDGLREGRIADRGYPLWSTNGIGHRSFQGGKQDLRDFAARVLAASPSPAPESPENDQGDPVAVAWTSAAEIRQLDTHGVGTMWHANDALTDADIPLFTAAPTQASPPDAGEYEATARRLREFARHTVKSVTAPNGDRLDFTDSLPWKAADAIQSLQAKVGELEPYKALFTRRMDAGFSTGALETAMQNKVRAESALVTERARANWLHGIVEESAPHRLTEDKPKETRE